MSFFLVFFFGLIALALALLLPALLRRRAGVVAAQGTAAAGADARDANLRVLREQLAALDDDLSAGRIDAAQHRVARAEIERRALEEEQAAEQPAVPRRAGKTAVVVGVAIPIFAVLVYAMLGSPQALVGMAPAQQQAEGEVSLPQIEAMVEGLRQRLESRAAPQEGDLQGWTMLANSYAVLQRFEDASRAFARARELAPDNAQLLADHADVLAMLQGQKVDGEPGKLVTRALQLEPNNLKALTMAGSWAFERGDYAAAVDYWGRAKPMAPPGSDFAAGLENSLQQARAAAAQGGQKLPSAATAAAAAGAQTSSAATSAAAPAAAGQKAGAGTLSGEVQVTPVLAKRVRATDTVFVFARAAEGPRMPLAIIRRPAGELPFQFTLDDSSAMSPQMRLSTAQQVVLGARISPTGDATPQSGDLVGQIGPVANGSGKLVLLIDGVVP